MADMKILKPFSKSPIDAPMIPQKILSEISTIIEISVDFDFPPIIEYQIYSPSSPYFRRFSAKKNEKIKET